MSSAPPEMDRNTLAAEFALGVLVGEELREAQALMAADAAFRDEVGQWLGRFAPLLDDVPEVHAPPRAWARIEQQIGAVPIAANDNARDLHRRLNTWRGVAAAAMALAASLAIVVVTRPAPVAPPASPPAARSVPAPMVAMLGEEGKGTIMVASWDPGSRNLVVAAAAELAGDPAHSHELWVIPADGTPRSLGTMPDDRPRMHARVDPAMARQLAQGATLAVSVEPRGGSPTGSPTGPVIAAGKLERA